MLLLTGSCIQVTLHISLTCNLDNHRLNEDFRFTSFCPPLHVHAYFLVSLIVPWRCLESFPFVFASLYYNKCVHYTDNLCWMLSLSSDRTTLALLGVSLFWASFSCEFLVLLQSFVGKYMPGRCIDVSSIQNLRSYSCCLTVVAVVLTRMTVFVKNL